MPSDSAPEPLWHPPWANGGLDIKVQSLDACVVVTPAGEVDLSTADQLQKALLEALETGTSRLIIDLSQLAFMDGRGLHVLVVAQEHAQRNGTSFPVIAGHQQPRRILELSGLIELLDVVPDDR